MYRLIQSVQNIGRVLQLPSNIKIKKKEKSYFEFNTPTVIIGLYKDIAKYFKAGDKIKKK